MQGCRPYRSAQRLELAGQHQGKLSQLHLCGLLISNQANDYILCALEITAHQSKGSTSSCIESACSFAISYVHSCLHMLMDNPPSLAHALTPVSLHAHVVLAGSCQLQQCSSACTSASTCECKLARLCKQVHSTQSAHCHETDVSVCSPCAQTFTVRGSCRCPQYTAATCCSCMPC